MINILEKYYNKRLHRTMLLNTTYDMKKDGCLAANARLWAPAVTRNAFEVTHLTLKLPQSLLRNVRDSAIRTSEGTVGGIGLSVLPQDG